MRFHVTRRLILGGCRGTGNGCPVWHAISEGLGDRLKGWFFSVTERSVSFCRTSPQYPATFSVPLPEIVTENIRRFDFIGEMEEFSFELDDALLARLDREPQAATAR